MTDPTTPFHTMAEAVADKVTVRGYDLCDDLLGSVGFGDMVFLETVGRLPTAGESRAINAILVCLVEHGMTASAIASRLTALGSPGSIQASIAVGVLGAGETFLGALEGSAKVLRDVADGMAATGDGMDEVANRVVADLLARGIRIPGFGHPFHKPIDPRTTRLLQISQEAGIAGVAQECLFAVHRAAEAQTGKLLPINADGACAAILNDMGCPPEISRGFACVARAAGVFGHLADEMVNPVADTLLAAAEGAVEYRAPKALFG